MKNEHELSGQVYEAKEDMEAADRLIGAYLPFIRSETAKFLGRPPQEGHDDELSIAMIAFHEAIQGYSRGRGAFLPDAALVGMLLLFLQSYAAGYSDAGSLRWYMAAAGFAGALAAHSLLGPWAGRAWQLVLGPWRILARRCLVPARGALRAARQARRARKAAKTAAENQKKSLQNQPHLLYNSNV